MRVLHAVRERDGEYRGLMMQNVVTGDPSEKDRERDINDRKERRHGTQKRVQQHKIRSKGGGKGQHQAGMQCEGARRASYSYSGAASA